MNAWDVPDHLVEMVADTVRLCRAANSRTRARDILRSMMDMHPDASEADIRRSMAYAATLLSDDDAATTK